MALFGGWRITRTGTLFIIGVVVLLAAVIGGIIWLRERSEQVRRDEAIKVAEETLTEQSNTEVIAVDEAIQTEDETASQASTQPTATELPATGAELNALLAIGLVTLAGGYYVSSRRAVRRLAIKQSVPDRQ